MIPEANNGPRTSRISVLSLASSEEEIRGVIEDASHVKCDLIDLNSTGKGKLRFAISALMNSVGKPEYSEDLSASVLELSFNALKANYAYVVVMGVMRQRFSDRIEKFDDRLQFFNDRILQRTYLGLVNTVETNLKVREALRFEKRIFDIQEKATKEKREPTAEETEKIREYKEGFTAIIDLPVKSTLRFVKTAKKVVIDVINDAPISQVGLDRIRKKREDFRKYHDEDRVMDFYTENLDESESAGFGSAMIDSRLLQWGYDPVQHFQVLALNNKACATLTLTF